MKKIEMSAHYKPESHHKTEVKYDISRINIFHVLLSLKLSKVKKILLYFEFKWY
jgi:hypothetical protein